MEILGFIDGQFDNHGDNDDYCDIDDRDMEKYITQDDDGMCTLAMTLHTVAVRCTPDPHFWFKPSVLVIMNKMMMMLMMIMMRSFESKM